MRRNVPSRLAVMVLFVAVTARAGAWQTTLGDVGEALLGTSDARGVVSVGGILVAAGGTEVIGLAAANGTVLWRHQIGTFFFGAGVVAIATAGPAEVVVVGTVANTLTVAKLAAATGTEL
jgi:hypothetical protein